MDKDTLSHVLPEDSSLRERRIQKALILVLFAVVISPLGALFFKNDSNIILIYYTQFIRAVSLLLIAFFALMMLNQTKSEPIPLKNYVKKIKPENALLIFMVLWMLLSCVLADDPQLAFLGDWRGEGFLTYISYFAIYLCAYIVADRKTFAKVFGLFAYVSYAAGILGLLGQFNVMTISSNNEIPASLFVNANHYGYYLAIALIASAYHFLSAAGLKKAVHAIGLFIIAFALFLSKCRGAWLAGILSLAALTVFIMLRKDKKPLAALFPLFITAAAFFATMLVYSGFMERLMSIFNDMNAIVSLSEARYDAGTARWLLWTTGVKLIPVYPIFGFGLDNLEAPLLAHSIIHTNRVHNEYLNYILTIGLVGAFAYFAFLCRILIRYLKKIKKIDFFSLAVFFAVISYLASAFFGNTTPYVTPYLFMFLGYLSRTSYTSEAK